MKVVELNKDVQLRAVVRVAPNLSDELELITGSTVLPLTWSTYNGRLVFGFDTPANWKATDRFDFKIKNITTDSIIYIGKLIVVKEGTDIQNYTPSTQKTQRFKHKE